jgi:hypothetical protein
VVETMDEYLLVVRQIKSILMLLMLNNLQYHYLNQNQIVLVEYSQHKHVLLMKIKIVSHVQIIVQFDLLLMEKMLKFDLGSNNNNK